MTLEERYKKYISSQSCLVGGCKRRPISHHLRGRYLGGGVSLKPGYLCCIPLCQSHHAEIHQIGINTFEKKHGLHLLRELVWALQGFITWESNYIIELENTARFLAKEEGSEVIG